MSTFGQTVKAWRLMEKRTQKEVAAVLNISAQYLNDIERDRRNPPSDALIERLAELLKGPTFYLFYVANRFPPELRNRDVLISTIMVGFWKFQAAIAEEEAA